MSIKDLKNWEIIERWKKNRISIEDLSKSQILDLKYYAKELQKIHSEFIQSLILGKSGTDFEYWAKRHTNYNEAVKLLEWIDQEIKPADLSPEAKPKLRMPEVALYCYYTGQEVTNQNKNRIVKKFGWKSGHDLYIEYNKCLKRIDRIGDRETKVLNKNQKARFDNVIKMLPDECKAEAEDDLKTFLSKGSKKND